MSPPAGEHHLTPQLQAVRLSLVLLASAALWAAITAGSAAGALSYLAAGLPVLWAGVAGLALVTGVIRYRQRAQE